MVRAAFALALISFSAWSWSQSYPTRPVKIVGPYGVGGSADVYARYLGAKEVVFLSDPSAIQLHECFGRIEDIDAEFRAMRRFAKNFLTGERAFKERKSAKE